MKTEKEVMREKSARQKEANRDGIIANNSFDEKYYESFLFNQGAADALRWVLNEKEKI